MSSVVSAEAVVAGHLPQTKFTWVVLFSLCPDEKKQKEFYLKICIYPIIFFLWE